MAQFTLEQYQALIASISEGALRVKYSDKEVEFRSLKEMLELKNLMEKDLCLKDSKTEKGLFGGRRIKARHSKGLC